MALGHESARNANARQNAPDPLHPQYVEAAQASSSSFQEAAQIERLKVALAEAEVRVAAAELKRARRRLRFELQRPKDSGQEDFATEAHEAREQALSVEASAQLLHSDWDMAERMYAYQNQLHWMGSAEEAEAELQLVHSDWGASESDA